MNARTEWKCTLTQEPHQIALPMDGGFHVGPLFIAAKRRAPKFSIRSSARWRFLRRRRPAWANLKALRQIKLAVKELRKQTGLAWSEDHIVPLNHPLVCGLHCEANIRIVLLTENLAKGNRTWPDMPEEQLELAYG